MTGRILQDHPVSRVGGHPHLALVADAVWNDRIVQMRYRRWKAPGEVTRTVSPLGVVLKAGRCLRTREDET